MAKEQKTTSESEKKKEDWMNSKWQLLFMSLQTLGSLTVLEFLH